MRTSAPNFRPGWATYLSHFTHYPVIIGLDMELAAVAPIAGYDQYLTVTIPLKDPLPNGFPKEEELSLFWKIERDIVKQLEKGLNAIYAGRTTTQGRKHLIFFLYDVGQSTEIIELVQQDYPAYAIESRLEPDPEWDIYFDLLFPNLEETNSLLNQRTVNRLMRQGDDLTQPRRVDHWIYFKTLEGRAAFSQIAQSNGFETILVAARPDDHHYPYLVRTRKEHLVDLKNINAITTELRSWARLYGGDYDGWETVITPT
ncbi:MAG: DUF695 domain-containing protein [Saprospiraceae bacterium]